MEVAEVELARPVVQWLQSLRWEVYQEVTIRGSVADIVAVQGPLVWIVEVKLQRSCAVIEQAAEWRDLAHYRSVAVPPRRRTGRFDLRQWYMVHDGIGELTVHLEGQYEIPVRESLRPRLNRRAHADAVLSVLQPEHKTFAEAGNAAGERWTPFRATCQEVVRTVRQTPGITMKELVGKIRHHYASSATARSSLAQWIKEGVVNGVRAEVTGGKLRIYPDMNGGAQ